MNQPLYLDVLFVRGASGGFENILNRTTVYFTRHDVHVRYIQMTDTGVSWATPEAEYVCLGLPASDFQFADARARYASLLKKDSVHPSLILAAGWPYTAYVAIGAVIDAGLSVPVAAWPHGDEAQYAETHVGDFGAYKFADCCFAISNRIASDFHTRWPNKTVYRVYNAFEEETVCYSEQRDTRSLAYVGRPADVKMVELILHALTKTAHRWDLSVIGDGPYRESLVALSEELRLTEQVRFWGWQDRPWALVPQCRALVVSSLYEGAPLTMIEALACGMQILSTPVSFATELIIEGKNGYLWPFRKPEVLASILDHLGNVPYRSETARICKDSVVDYQPDVAFADFLQKVRLASGITK